MKNFFFYKNKPNISKDQKYPYQGSLVTLLQSRQESLIMQEYMPTAKPEIVDLIIKEIENELSLLLKNEFANYFC